MSSSNSNLAMRQRRTVPLDAVEEDPGDHSVPSTEETTSGSSSRSSAHSRVSGPASLPQQNRSRHGHRTRARGKDSERQSTPSSSRDYVLAKLGSHHSRSSTASKDNSHAESAATGMSISIEELKRAMRTPTKLRTPGKSESMTIGSSSQLGGSRTMVQSTPLPLVHNHHNSTTSAESQSQLSSLLPDLFGLEEALGDCEDQDLEQSLQQLYMHKNQQLEKRPSYQNTPQKTPVAWKTPFEVDAPRVTPRRISSLLNRPSSPTPSTMSAPDPTLTEEQNAWAGIDALLDGKSLDDSFCLSTTDILGKAVVRGIRRDMSKGSIFEDASVFHDSVGSEGGSRTSKRSAESISKSSNSSSSSRSPRHPKKKELDTDGSHIAEDSFALEAADQVGPMQTLVHGRPAPDKRGVGGATSSGSLFDMFHWSEKDNVDETRGQKKKLNQQKHKVKLNANDGDDNCSLPSLSSYRDDDLASRSGRSDWDSFDDSTKGSIVTHDPPPKEKPKKKKSSKKGVSFGDAEPTNPTPSYGDIHPKKAAVVEEEDNAFAVADEEPEHEQESFPTSGPDAVLGTVLGTKLILDDQVDQYIQEMQERLPGIAGDNKRKKNRGLPVIPEYESPTSVVQEASPFEELPSLTSLSSHGRTPEASKKSPVKQKGGARVDEKKEAKPSLSAQLKNSIMKMRMPGKAKKVALPGRSEEKYFPKEVTGSEKFSANRCLLSQGDDGVNWDAD